MFASKSERKVRYSIRKFSIGVASVVVASLFLGGVVHAQGVGGGNSPMVTSSGQDRLKEYRQQLIKELEETALPEDKKAEYRKQIEQEMNYSVLDEIANNFHQESLEIRNKEHDEVVEKAKTEFPRYLDQILTGLEKLVDEKDPQFDKLIQEAKDIVEEYKRRFDEGIDSQDIKRLEQEGKNKLDKLVEDFKNSLSNQQSKPSGNETNSSSPTRSNSLSPTLSSQPTSTVQKVFTTQNGNTKITVMFETATEADSVNLKEVTTKEMIDNVTRQTGQGTVRIFDISLSKDGKETHVKGERVVRLAIGNIDSEIQVYHVKENGELELLPSTVENGQVVFKTSHFSLFAIKMLPKKQMVAEPEANREGKTQSDDKEMVLLADKANQMSENRSNSDKKDKKALPSTGTMSTLFMEFLGLISLVGVYLLRGKKTEND